MAFSPSVGDILMLSQTAWKIGRAFTQGKKSAPAEFAEVEREANGLSEALKLVAEALYSDNSILAQAEEHTKLAVSTILDSAHKTLSDLESFVERYRVIKKKETNGGFVVERAWSEVVIANYKTLKWTTEGGDIDELRNILHMHTNTINLTMQALQTKSLSRLERTVIPMAETVLAIHDRVSGDLGSKIDDLHRVIMAVSVGSPSLNAEGLDHHRITSNVSNSSMSTLEQSSDSGSPISPVSITSTASRLPATSSRPAYTLPTRTQKPQPMSPRSSPRSSIASSKASLRQPGRDPIQYASTLYPETDSRRMDRGFESGSPPERGSIADTPPMPGSGSTAIGTPASYAYPPDLRHNSQIPRRESTTLPHLFSSFDDEDTISGAEVSQESLHFPQPPSVPSPLTPPPKSAKRAGYFPPLRNLPPPALPPDPPESSIPPQPATPSSLFSSASRQRSNSSDLNPSGRSTPRPSASQRTQKRDSGNASENNINIVAQTFEKSLFRNAAILCDVRGTLVEYAHHIPEEPDPRYNTEMVTACTNCRIYVIRKRENRPHGGTKVVSSVWSLSDDGAVRCQQRLIETCETVPYCSYFQPEKVSIPPTHGEMTLRMHPLVLGDEMEKEEKSNWVNYVFESEDAANSFQSAIFGRTLLGSFRTTKTTVIHDGLKGAFAFEEQFANIEVLRLWEDDGTSTAGASGGVLALMHLGSNFGTGFARWWINNSKQQVRIKDEQTKFVKLKGIDVRTTRPPDAPQSSAASRKKGPERHVTGVRIEFKNEEERAKFVALAIRVQSRLLPLPDI